MHRIDNQHDVESNFQFSEDKINEYMKCGEFLFFKVPMVGGL